MDSYNDMRRDRDKCNLSCTNIIKVRKRVLKQVTSHGDCIIDLLYTIAEVTGRVVIPAIRHIITISSIIEGL